MDLDQAGWTFKQLDSRRLLLSRLIPETHDGFLTQPLKKKNRAEV